VLTENARRFADPATGKLDFESVLDGLLIDGLVEESAVQLMRSISRGPSSGKSLGPLERIAASGWKSARDPDVPVDLDFLSRWLADKVELPWRRIDPLNIDVTAVTAVMSSAYATRFNVICVEADVDHVVIGTTEPFDDEWQRELAGVLQKEVRPYEQRASDIHIEPRRETGAVRFRIDGVMQQVYEMPDTVMAAVTSRLKILGRMDVAEKRRPPGWSFENAQRSRQGGGATYLHHANSLWREDGHAHL